MPDYLTFEAKLIELEPEEAAEQLKEQVERLEKALCRLKESDRVSTDIYHRVVSL